jgi:hypothetical protein
MTDARGRRRLDRSASGARALCPRRAVSHPMLTRKACNSSGLRRAKTSP